MQELLKNTQDHPPTGNMDIWLQYLGKQAGLNGSVTPWKMTLPKDPDIFS